MRVTNREQCAHYTPCNRHRQPWAADALRTRSWTSQGPSQNKSAETRLPQIFNNLYNRSMNVYEKIRLWEWLDTYPRHIELVAIMYYNYSVSPEHRNMCDAYFNSLILMQSFLYIILFFWMRVCIAILPYFIWLIVQP